MEVEKSQSRETRRMRVTAALIHVYGDISDTHHDRCCTAAAAVAPLTLREGLLPPTYTQTERQNAAQSFKFLFFRRETSPLEKRIVCHKKPRIFPRGVLGPRLKQQL